MPIHTVAIVGASGNIGAPIVHALLAANYTVTAISRATSTATFPPSVRVIKTDLSSLSALTTAFTGQDAVIVTTASAAVSDQFVLVDAAVAAGVKRFLPSEFGHATAKVSGGLGVMMGGKTEMAAYVAEKARVNEGFSWTGVATSPFFDWGLDHGVWGVDLKERKVRVIDSGEEIVSTSTLGFVAKAVVAVLEREEETRNKLVEVVEFNVSQNEVVRILEEVVGERFGVERVDGKVLGQRGEEKLKEGDFGGAFFDLLLAWNFTDGGKHAVKQEEMANVWLGLKGQSVKEALKKYVKEHSE